MQDEKTKQPIGTLQLKTPIEILFEGIDQNIYHKDDTSYPEINRLMDKIPEQ